MTTNARVRKVHRDSNGNPIKNNNLIQVTTTNAKFLLKAKFDKKLNEWRFYSHNVVAFSWEDLQLPQVKHIEIVSVK
jgi:hypothetical protein